MPPGSSGASESAGWYSQAGAGRLLLLGPGKDRWLVSLRGCSGRGNHAQESGQSVPDAGQPCTPNPSKQAESHGLQDKKGDGRCSTQCVGDSPVERRGGAGYVGVFCAGSGGR